MKQTRLMMGMPITVAVADVSVTPEDLEDIFNYFDSVDQRFSTYKKESEISRINGGLAKSKWSDEMRSVLELCELTKRETGGYFDIWHDGRCDPSGLVKGWAIQNAAELLRQKGFRNYYVDAGGDIQASGQGAGGQSWQVGIRSPFNRDEIIKALYISEAAVATSGDYIRGQHIYNPHDPGDRLDEVASLTVVGPNIFDADRFATAAYAMGAAGVAFIEKLDGFEAYSIDRRGLATMTSGFERHVASV
ncbi:MAG TPA: FAD:protein FMN transferase [Candidatus Saccharimonadia bacterium]|nr:FAD:protein FMN transferase [Candidatus Saccharimonadia bacterium]